AGVLDESETHHLRDVLRLSAGDEIQVFDGKGGEFRCKVVKIERLKTHFSVLEPSQPGSPESPLDLEIASVLLKGDKLDTVVQKAA
ncbi:RsmE family RNA methyltransferase, partial [Escherichia coli]|nr:RsmE family RNA methyltransferase [Escherichia coli]